METNNHENITYRKAFSMYLRGFKLLNHCSPGLFASRFFYEMLSALIPYIDIFCSARILDALSGEKNPNVVWTWVGITVISTAIFSFLKGLCLRWKKYCQAPFDQTIDKLLADNLLHLDYSVLNQPETYDLYSQIQQNHNWQGWGLSRLPIYFEQLVQGFFRVCGAIALTVSLFTQKVSSESAFSFLNSFWFLAGFLVILVVTTLLCPFFSNKSQAAWVSCAEKIRFSNRLISFFAFRIHQRERSLDMRMYNQQNICDYYLKKDSSLPKMAKYTAGPIGGYAALSSATSKIFTGFAYLYVCLKAWAGAFGVGAVTQYVASITALSTGVSDILSTVGEIKHNSPFLHTTFSFLDLPNPMYQGSLTTEKRADRQYEVEFRNVSFHYPGSETDVLHQVSFRFRVGSRIAVVGQNGSGKSTFIKLLCRLYDPTEGEILLNGIDIRKYNYQEYLKLFAVVFQDFQLLSLPLGQNVAASEHYDSQKALTCLEKAGFASRMERMPEGLDTYLYKEFSNTGVEISGGEAQKIAIARALYKDSPFIILDEPTAALDPLAEAEIYSKFNEIAGDKTAIYISHRLSSCKFCDEILVFHEGAVVQQGTHDSLLKEKDGKYYELWQAQAQYYTE